MEGMRPTLSERSISGSSRAARRGSSTGEKGRAAYGSETMAGPARGWSSPFALELVGPGLEVGEFAGRTGRALRADADEDAAPAPAPFAPLAALASSARPPMILTATKRPMAARARTMREMSAARRSRVVGEACFLDFLAGRAMALMMSSRSVGDYTTPRRHRGSKMGSGLLFTQKASNK